MTSALRHPLVTRPDHDVIVIGTGFSGIGMAIQLKKAGMNDFVVLEKADKVGGTWRDNHYPGCACDVQSHLYSYSFERNPDWSRMYSPQPEIRAYIERTAEKYGVTPHIRYGVTLTGAHFEEDLGLWRLTTATGETITARAVVSGMGALSIPSYPTIKGRDSFKGASFHSQNWDHGYDLKGKRVAVIGTGASAIQFVPAIQPAVGELKLFQRTAPWVMPKPDREIGTLERAANRYVPGFQRTFRELIYWYLEARVFGFAVRPDLMKKMEGLARRYIRKQVKDPALRAKVTPDYTIGCKRVLLSNDYYRSLTQDNVEVVITGIREITARGVVTDDGVEHEVDAIIYGTGFKATDMLSGFSITGIGGEDLNARWKRDGAQAYLGTTTTGFPNLYFLMGPNTGLGHSSMVYMIESQIHYVMEALKLMQAKGYNHLDVKPEVQAAFNRKLTGKLDGTVWNNGGCLSWYRDEQGRNVTLWPDFTFRFRHATARLNPADYVATSAASVTANRDRAAAPVAAE
ncbi:flavin-containing monooxygenase [Zavarzinia compransoris]|nr:NAD(P)/FAD-dependent oxidoreductase [Zavarzinia compransoris]TDP44310.1 cation diffusion facilitator CzcD-associated flavoprotein CzcO [Zavarzinia compransoris]